MADNVMIEINVTTEEYARLAALAHEQGYATPADYVRALIETEVDEADAELDLDLDTKAGLMAAFRVSWHQAMTGNTRPIAQLQDELDDE
jgi:predicted DNA-binding protein